ncbi:energy transducer TonB [Pseudoalteromonas umbrosa]|uniref:energy transducer TonB n=1 Tax=Pseudoalteromonas umbrosa TaxID=3048489 RepID=UPI0024C2DDA5|nr:energy transducer TonB [Pseudoalteromonas sp. B95]MDK1288827.1 energy transducer TonB [Pseudoalteromonas sp. B95]
MMRFFVLLILVVALHALVLGFLTDDKEEATSITPNHLTMTLAELPPPAVNTPQQSDFAHKNTQQHATQVEDTDTESIVSTHNKEAAKQKDINAKSTPAQHKQLARPINVPQPVYPEDAKAAGQQGVVTVKFLVNALGGVESPRIVKSSGFDTLDLAAKNAIVDWSFYPTLLNEEAISHWYQQRIIFEIEKAHIHNNKTIESNP